MAKEWDILISGLNSIAKVDRAMRVALTSVLPIHKKRIFELGNDSGNSKIGTYSTKATSISKKNQARNTGHTYFKGGYSEYKTEIGKNPGYVNLRNTDQMQIDYGMIVLGNNQFGFGFTNSLNSDKSQWLQDKYKKDIFELSQSELDLLTDVLIKQSEGNS